ncbi:Pentatricopeptide repeat-containing protein [Nymphaea thermarum]|nr:Pentatricopeptide repeat-containing protein [Nymphaea thermarum]
MGSKLKEKARRHILEWGRIHDARKLFNEMPPRHVVPWNACDKEALNEFTFSGLFKACVELGHALGERVAHGEMDVSSLKANVFVGAAIIEMAEDARLVVVGHVQNQRDEKVLEMFGEMIRPDKCAAASGLIAWEHLLALRKGMKIHAVMIKEALEPEFFSYFCVEHRWRLFQGFQWDEQCRSGIMDCHDHWTGSERVGRSCPVALSQHDIILHKARSHLEHVPEFLCFQMVSRSISMKTSLHTDVLVAAALIDMYRKCVCMGMALLVFNNSLLEKDVVLFNAMISGYAQNDCGEEALQFCEEMQEFGIIPNYATFVSLL